MGMINSRRATKQAQVRGSMSHAKSAGNERSLASRLGGTVTPRSGAGAKGGDIQVKGIARIELKGTVHDSFSIKKGLMEVTGHSAIASGEVPVIVTQFINKQSGAIEDELAVMRLSDLEDLIKRANGHR